MLDTLVLNTIVRKQHGLNSVIYPFFKSYSAVALHLFQF